MVVHYIQDLMKILCQKGELKKRFYGKGLTPGWYPPEMDWTQFVRVSTSGTQEQKTRTCECILQSNGINAGNHYDGWEEEVQREEEAREARNRNRRGTRSRRGTGPWLWGWVTPGGRR